VTLALRRDSCSWDAYGDPGTQWRWKEHAPVGTGWQAAPAGGQAKYYNWSLLAL
jgi:hypothetical protein